MKKILITGANGLCGNALRRLIGESNSYWFVGREYGDLTIFENVKKMYDSIRPHYVVHTAAKVGGVAGNEAQHADFFYDNILMNTYMIDQAYRHNVEKMIVFSSVCVFPDGTVLRENNMHNGPVFSSNFSYGYAKRMVDVQIKAYQSQYGIRNYCSVIPGNIFGPQDLYDVNHGHVIPSLIHKLYLAKKYNTDFVVWGDGSSLREFIYVNDLAKVIYKLLELYELPQRLIVSGPRQYTIKEIVEKLVNIAEFDGNTIWDTSKPSGQHARPSSSQIFDSIFPNFEFTDINVGLEQSYKWFEKNYPYIRM